MGSRINATGKPAEDHEAARGEIACQALGHANAVRSRMAGANYGNAGLRKRSNVAANVEHKWGIVDLPKTRRVCGVIERDALNAGSRGFCEFVIREFDGASRAE